VSWRDLSIPASQGPWVFTATQNSPPADSDSPTCELEGSVGTGEPGPMGIYGDSELAAGRLRTRRLVSWRDLSVPTNQGPWVFTATQNSPTWELEGSVVVGEDGAIGVSDSGVLGLFMIHFWTFSDCGGLGVPLSIFLGFFWTFSDCGGAIEFFSRFFLGFSDCGVPLSFFWVFFVDFFRLCGFRIY
jgi:hypothetical protein